MDKHEVETQSMYEKNVRVEQYACDPYGNMTLGFFLRYAQEIATEHCDAVGLTAKVFESSGTAFLLAKVSIELSRPIRCGEKLCLLTRAELPERSVFKRKTAFYSEDKEVLGVVDSRWILIDRSTHRIIRRPLTKISLPFESSNGISEHEFSLQKIDENHCSGTETATFTRVDCNHHLNNAVYADIITDHVAEEISETTFIRKAMIVYHNELPLGEKMAIYGGTQNAEGLYYFCGRKGDRLIFESNVYMTHTNKPVVE